MPETTSDYYVLRHIDDARIIGPMLQAFKAGKDITTSYKELILSDNSKQDLTNRLLAERGQSIADILLAVCPLARFGSNASQLLAHFRNNGCPSICSFEPAQLAENETCFRTYLSLGFTKGVSLNTKSGDYQAFIYDIGRYNRRRSWNNAKFWANPENFNRYRW